MSDKAVMMIIPVENGFAFMPNDMDMLVSVGPKKMGGKWSTPRVSVARTVDELADLVREQYAKPEDPA